MGKIFENRSVFQETGPKLPEVGKNGLGELIDLDIWSIPQPKKNMSPMGFQRLPSKLTDIPPPIFLPGTDSEPWTMAPSMLKITLHFLGWPLCKNTVTFSFRSFEGSQQK